MAAREVVLGEVTPILRVSEFSLASKFYVDLLGFTVDWEHRFDQASPLYVQVSRGSVKLHLSEHTGDASPGAKVRINAGASLDALLAELLSRPVAGDAPSIVEQPWGMREMILADPCGNRLVFYADTQTLEMGEEDQGPPAAQGNAA